MTTNTRGLTADSTETTPASAGQGRTARLAADSSVLLIPVVMFAVPVVLVRAGRISDGYLILNLVSLLISGLVAVYAHMGWHARLHEGGLLSARTLTGRHTIDLARLSKVGRLEVPGQTRTDDRLILTDAHGVRVILNKLRGGDETIDVLVRRALMARPAGAGVLISDRAAERLDLRTELTRPHGRFRPGRKIREGLIGFLPLLSLSVMAPVAFGLLALAVTLTDVF
ncbi:hypothetical protein [Streptomyces sp. NRRL S-920]|uniref:hypothetical protein n=1 Tax=Streptomyces sp. NRRL S-920 TaxID=1463921 RepID=UPI0004C708A6|nr:hypothetical protein [Streptomyces sp. NRRL S-920]